MGTWFPCPLPIDCRLHRNPLCHLHLCPHCHHHLLEGVEAGVMIEGCPVDISHWLRLSLQYTTFLQRLPHDHGDDNDDDNHDHEDHEDQEKEMTVGRDVTSEKYQQGIPRSSRPSPHPPDAGDD